jgi:hypothetical protein
MQTKTDAVVDRLLAAALRLCPPARRGARFPPPAPEPGEPSPGMPPESYRIAARMRDEVLLPLVRARPFGRVVSIDTVRVMPFGKYRPRHELLRLADEGFVSCARHFRRTEYYADQARRHGARLGALKVARYWRLLRSARRGGLKFNPATRENLPVVFCARDLCFRMDGAHRASVARYLGHRRIPVVMVSPADVLGLPGLPEDIRGFAGSLQPPDPGWFACQS